MSLDALRLALEETIEGLQVIDHDWRYVYVNNAAASHGKTSPSELVGKTMMQAYPGIDTTPIFDDFRYVANHRRARQLENHFKYPDGSSCWFELSIEPHASGILIRSVDISERKKIEEQLRHAQKMEAVGRLAGGVAHDFNNKLSIMMAFCELLLDRVRAPANGQAKDETSEGYLNKLFTTIEQSASLTRQLLAFSRKQVLSPRNVDFNRVLRSTSESISRLIGASIEVEYRLADDLGFVCLDPTQLDQIILNLAANARDAMPDGGKIRIETSNVTLDEKDALKNSDILPGPHVLLSFSDTGTGMPKKVLERIFDPYFTTKEQGRGTGLGLAMVHGIVRQSHGHIDVYSEEGAGTSFKMYFPVVKGTLREPVVKELSESGSIRGSETILLVEDDEMLREAYERILTDTGYRVFSVRSPTEAESLFFTEKAKIDLLLTDILLPSMNGFELSKRLRSQKKTLKVLFMSGYTEDSFGMQGALEADTVLIQKPISIHLLQLTVQRVLKGTLTQGVVRL